MKKNLKVSIITVCYNSEQTIKQTIESVLKQTYDNIEYIIVDGASTDGTVQIIKKYEPLFLGRLKWVSEPDKGIYDALNKGIKMSKGTLIGVISSDDWYEEDAVENVVKEIYVDKPLQLIYGMTRVIKDEREYGIIFRRDEFLKETMLQHEACFITRKAYKKIGLYDTKYKIGADYDLILKMKESDEVLFVPVYKVLVNFRLGGISDSEECALEHFVIRHRHGEFSNVVYYRRLILSRMTIFLREIYNMICNMKMRRKN